MIEPAGRCGQCKTPIRVLARTGAYPFLRAGRGPGLNAPQRSHSEGPVVARNIRERVAIAFMACSLIVASVLGVMTVLAFQQGGLGGFSPSGQVSGQTASTGQNGGSTAATSGRTGSSSPSPAGRSRGPITGRGLLCYQWAR